MEGAAKSLISGSGGGTRTPDTRIMIPTVSEEYQSLECKQDENSPALNQIDSGGGVNEITPNWRSGVRLYAGEAVGPFHIWKHGDGWGVFNNSRLIQAAPEKRDATAIMMRMHSEWVPPPKVKRKREAKHEGSGRPNALCYFISMADGPIKIGASVKPKDRIRDLQAACPHPIGLLALAAGGFATEAAYHKRFAALRLHGEWFERHPDILAEIDRLNNAGPKRGCNLIPALSMNESELRYAC